MSVIKEKLKKLLKEKAEIACLAIKTSLRIMKKLIENLEKISNTIENITKIKLFLQITRITIDKVNEELKSCEGSEKSLFLMYNLF